MKKLLFVLLTCTLIFTGCEKVSEGYKEGTYEGSAVDNYGGQENTATAKITIDKDGKITSVLLDTTYTTSDGVKTTKKALKEAYGMKKGNSSYGQSDWEWYEQAESLEKAVAEHNGTDFLKLDEDGYTDAVSGCTIKVDALTKAIDNALSKAK